MTKLSKAKLLQRETAALDRHRPIVVELLPLGVRVWPKGTREAHLVTWDAILDLGHGQIETEFEVDAMTVPVKVEKSRQQDYWRYRLRQSAGLRVGAGGPAFTFASLNGDVRILKNK